MNDLTVFENGLVPVYLTDRGEKVVDGRGLWAGLESKTEFAKWIERRFNECDAKENTDYEVFVKNGENPKGGRPTTEYIINLSTAKEMAMLERNEIGKRVRKYFIQVEEKSKLDTSQLSPQMQLIVQMANSMAQQELRQTVVERRMDSIEEHSQYNCYCLAGRKGERRLQT